MISKKGKRHRNFDYRIFLMLIPVNLLLSCVIFASTIFGMAVDRISFPAASGVEKGPAISATNVGTRSLFKATSEISPSTS